jgi:hypothetical protein
MRTGYDVYLRCYVNMKIGAEQAYASGSVDIALGRERLRDFYHAATIGFASR